jgi:hypothetical protein
MYMKNKRRHAQAQFPDHARCEVAGDTAAAVPDRGEHLVRYYGWYSNRTRGMRNAALAESEPETLAPAEVFVL